MAETESMTLTLSREAVHILRQHIDAGEFSNETDAIEHAVRTLDGQQGAWTDGWLRHEVLPALQEALDHPERCLDGDQLRDEIRGWLHEAGR